MRWTKPSLIAVALMITTAVHIPSGSAAEEKRITVYSTAANYSLPVGEQNGHDYVGLLEILEPLGQVSAQIEGMRWKFRYQRIDAEFVSGRTRARIRGKEFDLPASFLLDKGRGLVPLSSLST